MNGIPGNEEEFRLWMVERVGEIQNSQTAMNGKLDVSIANHEALKQRVVTIEKEAEKAKWWENAKVLAMFIVQAAIGIKIHKA